MSLEDRLYPLLSVYERLPQGVRRALGAAYRTLPANWRWGARYSEFRKLTEEAERWSAEQTRDFQMKQLRSVLHHAANYCPFYQTRFIRAGFRPENVHRPEDLDNCPHIEKTDLL